MGSVFLWPWCRLDERPNSPSCRRRRLAGFLPFTFNAILTPFPRAFQLAVSASANFLTKGAGCALAAGQMTDMNALPIKNRPHLSEMVDDLIADFGARRVLLALVARLIKRTRPPDTRPGRATGQDLAAQAGVELLDDRVRADIGLPPKRERPNIDLLAGYSSRHWM